MVNDIMMIYNSCLPCLGFSLEGNGRDGCGSEAGPSADAFELADVPPLGVIAFTGGAAEVGVEAAAAAAFSPSLRTFTSDGSTNSAVNSRPP